MKKIIFIIMGFIALFFVCLLGNKEQELFTGYCVGKTYEKAHWSDKQAKVINYASPVYIPVVNSQPPKPTWEPSKFILHVANAEELRHLQVDSVLFYEVNILDKRSFR